MTDGKAIKRLEKLCNELEQDKHGATYDSKEFKLILEELGVSEVEFKELLSLTDINIPRLNKKRFYINLSPSIQVTDSKFGENYSKIRIEPIVAGENKNLGWKVILKTTTKKSVDISEMRVNFEDGEHMDLEDLITNTEGIHGEDICSADVHKGHLLAKCLYEESDGKSLIPHMKNAKGKKINFSTTGKCGKNNKYNAYWQFSRANYDVTNKDEKKDSGTFGQAFFEQAVKSYFKVLTDKGMQDAEVYYEVKAIFKNIEDEIPIGNRIKAVVNIEGELQENCSKLENFDVFIPNISHHKFYDFSYEKGFKRKAEYDFLDE
ncbi:MAG: hypothetical protein MRZ40_02850 [Ligilactobacillus animalis]|uniref:hypothetical protein n=1 Tax=Ligilactobacillus animalis TaxID=1605 RepID=UPI00242FB575|nr:hypothetical protein [Ligilactobacillus animalis]MCI5941490.1 hypothetical protein [Ligilactobacillus animalis]MDY2992227.1 hypothetical protein [Ligilactobacillus animalis]